jgi:hypothetical protein
MCIQDVEWLTSQLPNLRQSFLVDQFNHLDFLWAIEVDRYVNNRILDILANLWKKNKKKGIWRFRTWNKFPYLASIGR